MLRSFGGRNQRKWARRVIQQVSEVCDSSDDACIAQVQTNKPTRTSSSSPDVTSTSSSFTYFRENVFMFGEPATHVCVCVRKKMTVIFREENPLLHLTIRTTGSKVAVLSSSGGGASPEASPSAAAAVSSGGVVVVLVVVVSSSVLMVLECCCCC